MDYRQALDYLLSFADFERGGRFLERPDVEPVLSLLRRLADPHLGRRTVHIAGSKGKGSVAAMVESILRAAGLHTGLFTSPHLHAYTERVRIDGEPLSEDEWARHTETLREAVESEALAQEERSLVTFDLLTALAFLAFREHEVECQVLEVGLGGRVDSTNVFQARERGFAHVSAVTAIGLEHTDVLGDTIEEIAAEKAGIITPGGTVIIGPQPYLEAATVVRRAAASAGCRVVEVASECSWRLLSYDLDGQTFRLRTPGQSLDVRLPLLGEHQLENAATAAACADALSLSDEAVSRGLASVSWPARMEILSRRPLVVGDGAHSADSARRLRNGLTRYLSCRNAFLIIGMSEGKDVAGFARELAPIASEGRVIAVRSQHPRAMAPERVAEAFSEAGVEAEVGGEVGATLERALAVAAGSDVICLTGSLFVAAEGRAHFRGIAAKTVL